MPIESIQRSSTEGSDGTQLVTFLLKNEEFGFDIMSVQEIIRLPKMARLPLTPDYVEGVSSLRGAVLPIVDVRARFGMQREPHTDRSRVLVVDIDGSRTGLLVDSVRQVTRVARNEFEAPHPAIRSVSSDYIDGVVMLENGKRIVIALDARRVCSFQQNSQVAEAVKVSETEAGAENNAGKEAELRHEGGSMLQLVSFQIGREEFALPMENVLEILRVQRPQEVPGAPDHLLGVLTVRGKILPIVDLRRLMRHTSFASDHIAACRRAREIYESWLSQSGAGELQGAVKVTEDLRRWLVAFNSSSQSLMEIVARVRALNEQIANQASAGLDGNLKLAAQQVVLDELRASGAQIVLELQRFEGAVEGHIREDQRIIVVDSNGHKLGLVVDHVNQVLGVPKAAIEAPPNLAQQPGFTLSGIAKLDDGNRLILLLSTGNLLDAGILTDIVAANQGEPAAIQLRVAGSNDAEHTGSRGDQQFVTFLLDEEEFGIPILGIQEIDRLSRITKTPKAPRFVDGVTNLRGEVIPVLNTRALFELETKAADDRTRVIIVDLGGVKTGLVVDTVKGVVSIPTDNIAAAPSSISGGVDGKFISGIGKIDNGKRMIVLLDMSCVLTRSEQGKVAGLSRAA